MRGAGEPVYRAWRGPDGQAAGAAPPAPLRQSYGVPKALPLDEFLVAIENVVVALYDFRGLLRAEPLGADLVLLEESEELRVLHRPLISRDQLLPGLRMAVAEFGRGCETADGTVDHRNFHADFGKRLVPRRRVPALRPVVAHHGQRAERKDGLQGR